MNTTIIAQLVQTCLSLLNKRSKSMSKFSKVEGENLSVTHLQNFQCFLWKNF